VSASVATAFARHGYAPPGAFVAVPSAGARRCGATMEGGA
jgi:hypothetical protein